MKKLLFTLVLGIMSFVLCPTSLQAQTIPPPYINYQAVLYDVNGPNPNSPLTNQSFTTFVNINDELGNLLYREEHYASTDANGLITVKMGDGLYTAGPITNFNQINWGVGKYYLVVDFDINGTISSTAPEQLVTVPYSFYAGNAGNGMTAVADNGNGTLTFTYANGATYTTPTLAGIQGPAGAVGATGPAGPSGASGTDGQSAYDLWLAQGNTGTVQDFLSTSAYQIWLAQGNTGTAQDFLNTLVGPSGPQGTQGIPGTNGATGPQGSQGIQGIAGVNGVNGTDGRSAYEIAVLNGFVGTETQWLLSLVGATGPAGATGAQGPQGPAGNDGATGPQGPIGLTGATGLQGIQGPAGNDGATGPQGPIGLTGAEGLQGIQGPAGNDGAIGAQGPIGLTGATGPQGVQGPAGTNGLSAYETWLSLGNTGTEQDFINSLAAPSGGTQVVNITNPNGSSQGLYTVQSYLTNYGTGQNGNYNSVNGATLSTGQYTNFTIQAGHTVNLPNNPSGSTTTIMVKDTCRILGSINGKGSDMACGGCNTCVGYIQNGAGGGGGATPVCYNTCSSCYHHGPYGQSLSWSVYGSMETNLNPLAYSYTIAPTQSISNDQLLNSLQIRPLLHGGNGGWRCTGENSSGCGGKGLYIICKVLIFEGNIDSRGGIGKASTNTNCRDGAGGGGGGSTVISAKEILSNSGTILTTGGTGGGGLSGGCAGQTGGAGSYVILEMP